MTSAYKAYRQMYWTYMMSLAQVEILTLVSGEVLRDFPNNLPGALTEKLQQPTDTQKYIRDGLTIVVRGPIPSKRDMTDNLAFSMLNLQMAYMGYHVSEGLPDENLPDEEKMRMYDEGFRQHSDLGFGQLSNRQALIMIFAYLDAFMTDSLRVICRACPDVMRSEKKVDWTWNNAMEIAMKEDLIDYLIEQYVLEPGMPGIPKRIEFYRKKPFSLEINCSESEVKLLGDAENLRHIAVHNGGKVSQEYLKRTRRQDVSLGEIIPITFQYLEEVIQASRDLAGDIFESVSCKYLDVKPNKISRVHRLKKVRRIVNKADIEDK